MSRLDDAIADVAYILDSLMALRAIYRAGGNCNQCAKAKWCIHVPKPGQQVRYNCFDFVGGEAE